MAFFKMALFANLFDPTFLQGPGIMSLFNKESLQLKNCLSVEKWSANSVARIQYCSRDEYSRDL